MVGVGNCFVEDVVRSVFYASRSGWTLDEAQMRLPQSSRNAVGRRKENTVRSAVEAWTPRTRRIVGAQHAEPASSAGSDARKPRVCDTEHACGCLIAA